MSELPPGSDQPDEVDDLYRRASALDPSRPSEAVRRAVFEHAATLARERSAEAAAAAEEWRGAANPSADPLLADGLRAEPMAEDVPGKLAAARSAANQTWRRPAIFGTLAAACLAGLLIVPQFLPPRTPPAATTAALSKTEAARSNADGARPPAESSPALDAAVPETPAREASRPAAPAPEAPLVAQRQSAEKVSSDASPKLESLADARGEARVYGGAAPGSAAAEADAPARPPAAAGEDAATAASTSGFAARTDGAARPGMLAQPGMLASPVPHAPSTVGILAGRAADPAAELRRAAEAGDVVGVQAQLDKQVDVDARDPHGRTALFLATLLGRVGAVEALLSAGADPNAADEYGVTPLQAAVKTKQQPIAEALRRAGAR